MWKPLLAFITIVTVQIGTAFAVTAQGPQDFDRAGLYRSSCGPCHGATGLGGGPVAAALKDPVPVLATLSKRNGGVFPEERVYSMIDGRTAVSAHGSRVMPIWGTNFLLRHRGAGAESSIKFMIDALVEHVKSLQVE
jgi:mono/diheme cytochrome c family protein